MAVGHIAAWGTLLAQDTLRPWSEVFVGHLISGVIFAAIGLLVFALALWLIVKLAPFSVRKEIEEDQNMALSLIVGAMLIGISIIIAAAIQG